MNFLEEVLESDADIRYLEEQYKPDTKEYLRTIETTSKKPKAITAKYVEDSMDSYNVETRLYAD